MIRYTVVRYGKEMIALKTKLCVCCLISVLALSCGTAFASSKKVIPGITPEFREDVTVTQESRPMQLKYFRGRHWRLLEERVWRNEREEQHMDRIWEDAKGRCYVERVF